MLWYLLMHYSVIVANGPKSRVQFVTTWYVDRVHLCWSSTRLINSIFRTTMSPWYFIFIVPLLVWFTFESLIPCGVGESRDRENLFIVCVATLHRWGAALSLFRLAIQLPVGNGLPVIMLAPHSCTILAVAFPIPEEAFYFSNDSKDPPKKSGQKRKI